MEKNFNFLMRNAISLWVIYKFLDIGDKIYLKGHTFTKIQSDTFEYYISWFGCAFFAVIFTWFKSAVPFLKDIIASLVTLRTGRQEPTPPTPILPPQPTQFAYPPAVPQPPFVPQPPPPPSA